MKVLISCHNYYPTHSGGTEFYISNLIRQLPSYYEIVIISAANRQEVEKFGIKTKELFNNKCNFTAFIYQWETIRIIGIELKFDLIKNYSRYSENDKESFKTILNSLNWNSPDEFWMHGFTAVSGLSLFKALKEFNSNLHTVMWLHTVFICPKESLMMEPNLECYISPEKYLCTHCLYLDKFKSKLFSNIALDCNKAIDIFWPKHINKLYHVELHLESINDLTINIDNWICFSTDLESRLHEIGVAKSRIFCQMHGIDFSIFNNNDRINYSSPTKFVYSGRWLEVKGFYLLCAAWLELAEDINTRVLLIAGTNIGTENQEQLSLINRMKLRNDVIWLGFLTQRDLANQYRQSHVLIIPSLTYETGPFVFHEAIACGCQVISTNIGGNKNLSTYYKCRTFEMNVNSLKSAILDSSSVILYKSNQGISSYVSNMQVLNYLKINIMDDNINKNKV